MNTANKMRIAALASLLAFAGCFVPACTPTTVNTPPTSNGASGGVRMGSLAVKDGTGTSRTLKTREDTGEHISTHDVERCATGALDGCKAEDAVHATGDVGVLSLAVRADTPTATAADGDNTPLLTDSSGRLHTTASVTGTITASSTTGAAADGAAVSGNPVLMAGTDGTNAQTIATDASGVQYMQLRDAAGNARGANVDASNRLQVFDNNADTYWQYLIRSEDTAASDGETGLLPFGVRRDTPASSTATDGDKATFNLNGDGRLYTAALATGASAAGAAVSGNPVLVGGTDGTNARSIKLDTAGEAQVDVLTLPALAAGTSTIGATLNASSGPTIVINDVATSSSSNSSELDWSAYSGVWVECLFDGASAAVGTIMVWGCLVTGGCTSGSAAERAYLLADVLHDTQITQTVAGDNELDVAYSAEGEQRVSFHIQTPKPFNLIKWSRTSGGDADGLTCRTFARAL